MGGPELPQPLPADKRETDPQNIPDFLRAEYVRAVGGQFQQLLLPDIFKFGGGYGLLNGGENLPLRLRGNALGIHFFGGWGYTLSETLRQIYQNIYGSLVNCFGYAQNIVFELKMIFRNCIFKGIGDHYHLALLAYLFCRSYCF